MDNAKLPPGNNTAIERAAEINNALAVILGNAQLLLLRNPVAPGDRDRLRAIEQSSFRIQTLMEQILLGK